MRLISNLCHIGEVRGLALLAALILAWAPPAGSREHSGSETEAAAAEHVVLIHGLGRSEGAMRLLAERLREAGYLTHNLDYPSRHAAPEELVAMLADKIESCCEDAARLHFVGHSLGGILARAYIAEQRPSNLGRLVMLSPPNRGSELVDKIGESWLFQAIMGPSAETLGTDPDSFPNRLPAPDYDVGVIAATGSINPLGSVLIPGDDDGMVSVCNMRLDGMADFIRVDHTHAFIMRSQEVAEQTIAFLRHGRFDHDAASGDPEMDCDEPE